ncbi:MMPL family transporter [Jatrophihabitans sp.]|uniref:MMPL family transporter n=1 Tax=Jatrophihabitans sp. TaxID=1932789 RepID=UPI0030C6CB64|nr:superfamily drug exporter-like protein [Jatrophihabitans sp.]
MSKTPPLTVRMARWSALNPWKAIAGWLVFVVASIAIGSLSGLHGASDLDETVGQSGTAAHWLHDAHLEAPDTENVLVTPRAGSLDQTAARAALAAAATSMRALSQVAAVGTPITSTSGQAMTIQVTLRHDAHVAPLLAATKAVQARYPGLRVEEVGSTSLDDAVGDQVSSDLSSAAVISLPVTLVILLVAFGAIIAAGVPLLLALSAVGSATGLASLASHVFPADDSTSSMILLMGMAVGVDYSLFFVKRAREEWRRGASRLDAVEIAAETSGHSVLVSGLAVIVAMFGLYLVENVTFTSLATGSIIVVGVAVLGSLTVLPALLVKLGRGIDRPRVPVLWRLTSSTREPRLWPALLRPSLTRPARTLTVSVLALGALALPALGLTLHSYSPQGLPDSVAAKHTLLRLTSAFPSQNSTQEVVVKAAAAQAGQVDDALRSLAGTAARTRLFVGGAPQLRASADGTVHLLRIDAPFDSEATQARHGIRDLREHLVGDALRGVGGARWAVGGDTASNVDADQHLSARLPWVIGFVVLLTMLIMGWVFRSVVIALTTAAVNLLSAGASFGVLVLVFQHTWADSLLGFHSTGAVVNWIPLFTFAVLFGLSMDYHVFVISRIREAMLGGLSTRDAIRVGITGSAGTVTSAAFVMVSVFAIFASLHMVEMKELGLGLAVAVLVDALVVRVIVLPSLMMLLGRWNWWPGRVPVARPTATVVAWPATLARSGTRGT